MEKTDRFSHYFEDACEVKREGPCRVALPGRPTHHASSSARVMIREPKLTALIAGM